MTDTASGPAQAVLGAIRRLEAGTGRDAFAADQIIEEVRRVERSVDAEAALDAIRGELAHAPPGGERLESIGDDLYRRRGGAGPEAG